MYKTINIGGKDYHYKLNNIAKSQWEQKTGKHRTKLTLATLEDEMMLIHCAMVEGHKIAKKKFDLTLDQLWDLEREHDFYDKLLEIELQESEKK